MIDMKGTRPIAREQAFEFSIGLLQQLAAAEASRAEAFAARDAADAARNDAEARSLRIEMSTIWQMTWPLRASLAAARRFAAFAGVCLAQVFRHGPRTTEHPHSTLSAPPTMVAQQQLAPAGALCTAGPTCAVVPSNTPLALLKQQFRDRCSDGLDATLAKGEQLSLPAPADPRVSILVVVHNQAELTFHCLQSLAQNAGADAEIIILDNASSDRTHDLLSRVDGARVIRAEENLHFVRGVNRAAKQARGEYLLLLNNDTSVPPGAVGAAAARLDAEPDLGAVGGPILQLDGTLQEAGSIIWRNGYTEPYGQGADPDAWEFQFRRDVDYCSGAFLMVRRNLWERLGGFDEAFAPAYYDETDLCMRIRAAGFRVGYEPKARLVHFAYGSATSSHEAAALYERNRKTFLAHHAAALAADHHEPQDGALAARVHGRNWCRALILDADVTAVDGESGSTFAGQLVHALRASGAFVTYCRLGRLSGAEHGDGAIPDDVETVVILDAERLAAFLRQRTGYYGFILHGADDLSDILAGAADPGHLGAAVIVRFASGNARRTVPGDVWAVESRWGDTDQDGAGHANEPAVPIGTASGAIRHALPA